MNDSCAGMNASFRPTRDPDMLTPCKRGVDSETSAEGEKSKADHRLVPDITRSDHFPFWNAGKPALLWTDGGNFRNPHQRSDTPETLEYALMRDVAELLCAIVTEEAR